MNHSGAIETLPRRRRRRRDQRRLSQMLRALIAAHPEPRMNVWQLRDALADRAYGVLLFVFALPLLVPLPPGVNTVFAVLIMLVAAQFVLGLSSPYFPSWLGRRSFERETFEKAFERVRPPLRWIECLLQPRLLLLTSRHGERLIGLFCIFLGLVAASPLPFGHQLPALSVCVIALAVLERDGIILVAGFAVGLIGVLVYWALLVELAKPLIAQVAHLFGS